MSYRMRRSVVILLILMFGLLALAAAVGMVVMVVSGVTEELVDVSWLILMVCIFWE